MTGAAADRASRAAPGTIARVRRPRWRAYLLLARVSNLPTIWSNTLAGAAAAGAAASPHTLLTVALATSLFYTGGMFLNDAFDVRFDRTHRPERPVPAGDVSRAEAFVGGGVLLLGAELLLVSQALTLALGALLAAAIVLYDSRHKHVAWAPVVMGACRGLVYCLSAAAISAALSGAVLAGAALMIVYVSLLTVIARRAGANARWLVPTLIAGISILDAVFVAAIGGPWTLAVIALAGFPLTLFLQQYVPGD